MKEIPETVFDAAWKAYSSLPRPLDENAYMVVQWCKSCVREAVKAALSAAQGQEWRPIAEAPRDGTLLLLFSAYRDEAITGLWQDVGLPESVAEACPDGIWVEDLYVSYDRDHRPYRPIHEVTRWMPLPPPPLRRD